MLKYPLLINKLITFQMTNGKILKTIPQISLNKIFPCKSSKLSLKKKKNLKSTTKCSLRALKRMKMRAGSHSLKTAMNQATLIIHQAIRLNLPLFRKMDRRNRRHLNLTRLRHTMTRRITRANMITVRTLWDMKPILQNQSKKNPPTMTLTLVLAIQRNHPRSIQIHPTMTLYPKNTQHPNLNNNNQHHHSTKSKYLCTQAHHHNLTNQFFPLSVPLILSFKLSP